MMNKKKCFRLCVVQRVAGAPGEDGVPGHLDQLCLPFSAAVYGEYRSCHLWEEKAAKGR